MGRKRKLAANPGEVREHCGSQRRSWGKKSDGRGEGEDRGAGRHYHRAVLFVASLIWKNWATFGANVRYEIEVGGESGFVTLPSPLTPSAVAGEDGNGLLYQVEELVMSTEQVRFKLKMPYDSLSRLAFEIEYGGDPDELILGVVNVAGNELISRPVHNRS